MDRKSRLIIVGMYVAFGALLVMSVVGMRYPKLALSVGSVFSVSVAAVVLVIAIRRAWRGTMQWKNKQYSRSERPAAFWGLLAHHLFYVVVMGALGAIGIASLLGRLR